MKLNPIINLIQKLKMELKKQWNNLKKPSEKVLQLNKNMVVKNRDIIK
eukprot:CAMPEP_0201569176 /NCGR_PEP_ID=MMETSP0190_2-20130828/10711_1 /ASSEMBLY_ACC=CAM_ASM_000263 /TAXON_ID=37353 /ORGANISM="Rosalina sp." /LENGTH=47 /DNA_ID= /DNA_START= /DNA_END= /DNA_ORIENTATION=